MFQKRDLKYLGLYPSVPIANRRLIHSACVGLRLCVCEIIIRADDVLVFLCVV